MSDFTLVAGDIIESIVQDSQVQTTNRKLLLDHLNRVQQRILRESKWLFLQSEPKRFVTEPGVADYWIGSTGSAPAGSVDTALNLSDVANITLDSVFDLTNKRALPFNSDRLMLSASLRYADGNYRKGRPLSFSVEYGKSNILTLDPLPDNQNSYLPVPSSCVCSYQQGGNLFGRVLYVAATLVDSFGNESTTNGLTTKVGVPGGNLLTVQAPEVEVSSASLVTYNRWNVYAGYSENDLHLQNSSPLLLSQNFIEPISGITRYLVPNNSYAASTPSSLLFNFGVTNDGLLTTTATTINGFVTSPILQNSIGQAWQLSVTNDGIYVTTYVPDPSGYAVLNYLYLQSTDGLIWKIGINSEGLLTSTYSGTVATWSVEGVAPPSRNRLTPLYGYVIEFRYQKQRQAGLTLTSILQIPYQYRDVVVAGVNYYASLYIGKGDEALRGTAWKTEFNEGLAQIRRDLRINNRHLDALMPDRATQGQNNSGWGWDLPRP